jgi:hypothetical protein
MTIVYICWLIVKNLSRINQVYSCRSWMDNFFAVGRYFQSQFYQPIKTTFLDMKRNSFERYSKIYLLI